MIKKITVNITDAKNECDVLYRIYKSLNWFPIVSEQEYLKRIETENYPIVWNAFSDDMCGIDSLTNAGFTELYLTIRGLNSASNTIGRYESGNSFSDVLASVLMSLTDPKQRCDNIKFYPQFILE